MPITEKHTAQNYMQALEKIISSLPSKMSFAPKRGGKPGKLCNPSISASCYSFVHHLPQCPDTTAERLTFPLPLKGDCKRIGKDKRNDSSVNGVMPVAQEFSYLNPRNSYMNSGFNLLNTSIFSQSKVLLFQHGSKEKSGIYPTMKSQNHMQV